MSIYFVTRSFDRAWLSNAYNIYEQTYLTRNNWMFLKYTYMYITFLSFRLCLYLILVFGISSIRKIKYWRTHTNCTVHVMIVVFVWSFHIIGSVIITSLCSNSMFNRPEPLTFLETSIIINAIILILFNIMFVKLILACWFVNSNQSIIIKASNVELFEWLVHFS